MRHRIAVLVVSLLVLTLGSPALAGGIAIRGTTVTDNGDDDGFADTLETATVLLTIENTSGELLTDVVVSIRERTPGLACVSTSSVTVGDMGPGELRTLTDGFAFTVANVDRTTLGLSAYDDLAVEFGVVAEAGGSEVVVDPSRIRLDLDLDISGGSGSATYFESFEGDLGTFEVQNLDENLDTLAASDGYRCQYNDPDFALSNGTARAECYLGNNPFVPADVFWELSGPAFSPDGGRGFSGFHSLVFTVDMGPPLNWTTPLAVMEAAAMSDPVHIAADAVDPQLTFKHQVSLADSVAFNLPPTTTYDSGVVQVQVADDAGNPAGPWLTVEPFANGYRSVNNPFIITCAFDPIDDGSTEDDFFSPALAGLRYGPSSTCYPQKIYANIGETSNTFNAANVGQADGPGLQGLWGIGTWVESRVDLSRYRGRSIRVRFLASTMEVSGLETWHAFAPPINPGPGEDGWWIDDVEVTGLVSTPATVAVDDKDNSSLPGPTSVDADLDGRPDVCDNCSGVANAEQYDGDLDGVGDLCDICPLNVVNVDPDLDSVCAELDNCPFVSNSDQADVDSDGYGAACDCNDNSLFVNPDQTETNNGVDDDCGDGTDEIDGLISFPGPTTLDWVAQIDAARYQVARATSADFTTNCTGFNTLTNSITDSAAPVSGGLYVYLVRSTLPNQGSWGADSGGSLRTVPCLP